MTSVTNSATAAGGFGAMVAAHAAEVDGKPWDPSSSSSSSSSSAAGVPGLVNNNAPVTPVGMGRTNVASLQMQQNASMGLPNNNAVPGALSGALAHA